LKTRAKSLPPEEQAAQPQSPPEKAQLLGYDQPPSFSQIAPAPDENPAEQADAAESNEPHSDSEAHPQQREEAELFAYISGEKTDSEKEPSPPRPWLKKLAIAAAVVVAGSIAYFAVPQTVMQKGLKAALGPVIRAGHSWLNPPPVTTPQAPQSHESFGRAGDEYKLPVAENIPDANTDPSQIRVVPMIDPTVKPPNNAAAGTDPNAAQAATPGSTDPAQTDPNQAAAGQVATGQTVPGQTPDGQTGQNQPQENQPQQSQTAGNPSQSVTPPPQQANTSPDQQGPAPQTTPGNSPDPLRPSVSVAAQPSTNPIPTAAVQTTQSAPVIQPVHRVSVPVVASHNASTPNLTGIPSSLKSQMAQMSPEASGNKAPEAALPSIEPVNLPEAAARGLLVAQPTPAYPPSARGQTGSVVLQVLIGRDGTVQDAKFLQGSLAFARPAIDAVKQWRFKPYLMNGRPASTQTLLTLSFKPAS
jgi:protein TonB